MQRNAAAFIVWIFMSAFFGCGSQSSAEETQLTLQLKDLAWFSCRPNESIYEVLETIKNRYKIEMSSMEDTGYDIYVAGDPTPAMAWILELERDHNHRLIAMEYGRFKESTGAVKIKTSRGIEIGNNLIKVFNGYGKSPIMIRSQDPLMNYIVLEYPFMLEETGQRGRLSFTLEHGLGTPEENAVVIKMKWHIN